MRANEIENEMEGWVRAAMCGRLDRRGDCGQRASCTREGRRGVAGMERPGVISRRKRRRGRMSESE